MYSVFQAGCPEEIKKMGVVLEKKKNLLEMNTAVVTCTNKDNSHFLSLLDKLHCSLP